MRQYLEALQGGAMPGGLSSELPALFGVDAFAALIGEGVLLPGDLATWYPCPQKDPRCARDVIANPDDAEHPFLAVPPDGEDCCEPTPLTAAELTTLYTSKHSLVALLRKLFNIEGHADLRTEVFPCAYIIGRTLWHGMIREVLFATDLNEQTSGASTALTVRELRGQPTLVLAHGRTRFTSRDVLASFVPGKLVEVVFLEDVLAIDGTRIVIRNASSPRCAESLAPYTPCSSAFCVVIDHDGRREIDEATYREITSRSSEYDLFIDLLSTVRAGRYRSGHTDEAGVFVETSLSFQQAWAYAELVERRQPMRPSELRALSNFGASHKQIEAARRALDLQCGWRSWRSTVLITGSDASANQYLFKPPADLRFAVVRPINGLF